MANNNTVEIKLQVIDDVTGAVKNITGSLDGIENVVKKVIDAARKQKEVFDKTTDSLFKLKTASDALKHIGDTIMQTAAPAMEFQQRMSDLSAITGVVGEDLDAVAVMARRIGKESGLGAAEAARAFSVLAGQLDAPVEDIGLILEKSATLAQAAGLTIDDAANSLAATISQYGLAANDADRIMNVLAAGSRVGASEVVDLAQSFKVVGAAASSLGVDVEHTAGALEVLGGANIKGAEAGTALRNVLLSLKTKLGIDTSVVDLSDALSALKPKLQDTEFLAKTFGIANVTAATYLIQNADSVREMTDAVTETQAAQEQAEIRNATWSHQLEVIRAQFDDFKISIGTALGPMAAWTTVLSDGAQQFVALGEATKLAGALGKTFISVTHNMGRVLLNPLASVRLLRLRFNMLRTSLMKTAAAQKVVIAVTKVWTAVQKVFNVIMSMNPIVLIVLGIMALIGVVYLVIEAFKKWGDEALMLFGPLGSMILAFKTHWDSIVDAFKNDGIIAGLKRIGEVLMDVLLRPVQKLLGWVGELTGWDWAKKAANWVQEVRIDHNLVTDEEKRKAVDPATGKPADNKVEKKSAKKSSPLGINLAANGTATKATAQSSQIKRIDITIDKVVENFTVATTNMQQAATDVRDMVARALIDAVNDVNYAM